MHLNPRTSLFCDGNISTPNDGPQERNGQVTGATITPHGNSASMSAGANTPHPGRKKRQTRAKGSRQAPHRQSPAAAAAVVKAKKKRKILVKRKRDKQLAKDMVESSTVLSSSVAMKDGETAGHLVMDTMKDGRSHSDSVYCWNSCLQASSYYCTIPNHLAAILTFFQYDIISPFLLLLA